MSNFKITVECESNVTVEEMEDIMDKALNDACITCTFDVEETTE